MTGRREVRSEAAPQALGPYSQGVLSGQLLFVSGQLGLEPSTGTLVEGGVVAQTARVLDNLLAVIQAAGFTSRDIVKTTIYVTDLGDFQAINEIYGRYFEEPYPARATVEVAALPKGASVEIDAIAARA
jgi:2-iminobutanoate/2-iminopropanoate deaminase